MNRRAFCLGLAAQAGLCVGPSIAAPQPNDIMVAIANNVFANLWSGQPTGILVETIDIIVRRMGRKPVYIVMPPSEMSAAFANGTIAINSVAVESSSNKDIYLFSDPIISEYNVVALRADQSLNLSRLSDLYGLKLGGRTGYQYPLLDADPRIELQHFPQDGELIRNLIHKRIDAAVISAISDVYKLRTEGVMSRIKLLSHSVGEVPLRAALSPSVFSREDLDRFNALLFDLKKSMAWTNILARNGMADLVVEWPIVAH